MLQPRARQVAPGIDPRPRPGYAGRRAAARRWRRPRRRRGSRARPRGGRCPARRFCRLITTGPQVRMAGDVVVDVLRRVGLVVHDEAAIAEAEVLHEDRVALHWALRRRFASSTFHSQSLRAGCSQSVHAVPDAAGLRRPRRSGRRVAPKATLAPGPTSLGRLPAPARGCAGRGGRSRRRAASPGSG